MINNCIRKILRQLGLVRISPMPDDPFLRFAPPGHFYSPLPDHEQILRTDAAKFGGHNSRTEIPGIALDAEAQLNLLGELAKFYPEFPYPATSQKLRYKFDQPFYGQTDAFFLYGILRRFQPRRLIEVGSGFSSALILDTNDLFFKGGLDCTFIEPYPERLISTLRTDELQKIRLIKSPVQEVPVKRFAELETNDILLIDSSHVSKHGSDVNYLFFEVLPTLKPGVVVHIHDIFFPFDYPKDWFVEGRAWNEAYLVRAFLSGNPSWKILLFADFVGCHYRQFMSAQMPVCLQNGGGSLWLQKR